jgi:uncharacterized protein (DUF433 family)
MLRISDLITIDKDIVSGTPVFKGTRVPIQSLFDHLEKGIPIGEFLLDFPTVQKEQAIAILIFRNKNLLPQ